MSRRQLTAKQIFWFYAAGLLCLLVAGGAWWYKLSADPQRAFWNMLSQSLATSSVTVQSSQTSNGASVAETLDYTTGAADLTDGLTTIQQGTATVTDESLGTPTADYTRYVRVATQQKSASGKPLDFSSVLGVWAKTSGSGPAGGNGNVQFSQAVLGTGLPLGGVAVPIANLSPAARGALIATIRTENVYDVDFSQVKKTHQNGRLLYSYTVNIQPILYAAMMKSFAQAVGIHDLDSLDPNSFSGQQRLTVQLTIDVLARHLVTATGGGGISQTYSGYDVPLQATAPAHAISASELQTKLTNLQK